MLSLNNPWDAQRWLRYRWDLHVSEKEVREVRELIDEVNRGKASLTRYTEETMQFALALCGIGLLALVFLLVA
jgi:hypothetical protein